MENKQIKLEYRRHLLDLLNDYPYPEWYERQDIRKKVESVKIRVNSGINYSTYS